MQSQKFPNLLPFKQKQAANCAGTQGGLVIIVVVISLRNKIKSLGGAESGSSQWFSGFWVNLYRALGEPLSGIG
jgi:hypothetical protein